MPVPTLRRVWLLSFVCALCLTTGLGSSSPHFAAHAPPPVPQKARGASLRIAAPSPERQPAAISAYGPGFEQELIAQFCEEAAYSPTWIIVADREEGLELLREGTADVLVGFSGDLPGPDKIPPPPADDAQTPAAAEARQQPALVGGPPYAPFKPIRVRGISAPPRTDADPMDLATDPEEKADSETLLLDPAAYALWLPHLGPVSARQSGTPVPYRWFWRADASSLSARLAGFWAEPGRRRDLAELTERYFGFLPRSPRPHDVLDLADAVANRLPRYQDMILSAARETGVPPLFLTAVIYQESRFDAQAVSETGVRGIMQLTGATARMLGVNRKDPAQCILGGARYLRELWDQVGDRGRSGWDRWFMALAAYNQGMGTLNQAIRISRGLGDSGATWAELKRAYPHSTVGRGYEARSFVEKVRYYHFMLCGLVALSPMEAQDLAPLRSLALAPVGSVIPGDDPDPS